MNTDQLPKSNSKLAWLAPWSFGCVTVLEYLFKTGLSSLIEEHDEKALEDARTAYFLEAQTKTFDMSKTNSASMRLQTLTFRLVSNLRKPDIQVPTFLR
jgi:hypothetical protein